MFYPSYSYSYSYSYSVFNYNLEEKNNNSQLLNKIIEPTINYVSLEKVDIDIDDQDVACFENDDDEIVCFDKNAINDDDSLFVID